LNPGTSTNFFKHEGDFSHEVAFFVELGGKYGKAIDHQGLERVAPGEQEHNLPMDSCRVHTSP